ncbi:MAG TPA: ABC transporter substrate-binding protein, partial [Rhodopila sp.]|nr:ABC transporter substrate-binding protein [Rhodopila sp.]
REMISVGAALTMTRRRAIGLALGALAGAPTVRAQGTATPLKLGVLSDMDGPYGDLGGRGSIIAAQMAVQDFGGSVLGRPIAIISADHLNKPDVAVTIARRWFDQDGVTAIFDLTSSPVALAVQALAAEKKRLSFVSTASIDALTGKQCSPLGASWTFDSYSLAKIVATALATPDPSWFFLGVDNAGGDAMQNALTPFLRANGAKIIGSARHPYDTPDMSAYLLQAQSSGAGYIAVASSGSDLVNVIKQAREFGLSTSGQTLVGMPVFMSTLKAMGLDAANGLAFATGFASDASPEAAAWSQRLTWPRRMNGSGRKFP